MSKFDEQEKRWEAILGDSAEGTQEQALEMFFKGKVKSVTHGAVNQKSS